MDAASDRLLGTTLSGGRYRIIAKLGEGGMGHVYRAHDANIDADVVVKMPRKSLLDDRGFAERFAQEVRALVRLSHPHIVRVTDVGEHEGLPFAVMQYLPGKSLEDLHGLGEGGTPRRGDSAELATWLPAVAGALDFAHKQGYIHRDVKPANILFDAQGHAFLGDFGVAKLLATMAEGSGRAMMTGTGVVLGTPGYMSPEIILGDTLDGRSDQYGLAVAAYEVLAGQRPFVHQTPTAVLMMQTTRDAPSLAERRPDLPPALSAAIARALSRDPAARFPDCASFASAVIAAASGPARGGNGSSLHTQPVTRPAAITPPSGVAATTKVATASQPILALVCPSCAAGLKVSAGLYGTRLKCPSCKMKLVISDDLKRLLPAPALSEPGEGLVPLAESRTASAPTPRGGTTKVMTPPPAPAPAPVLDAFEDVAPLPRLASGPARSEEAAFDDGVPLPRAGKPAAKGTKGAAGAPASSGPRTRSAQIAALIAVGAVGVWGLNYMAGVGFSRRPAAVRPRPAAPGNATKTGAPEAPGAATATAPQLKERADQALDLGDLPRTQALLDQCLGAPKLTEKLKGEVRTLKKDIQDALNEDYAKRAVSELTDIQLNKFVRDGHWSAGLRSFPHFKLREAWMDNLKKQANLELAVRNNKPKPAAPVVATAPQRSGNTGVAAPAIGFVSPPAKKDAIAPRIRKTPPEMIATISSEPVDIADLMKDLGAFEGKRVTPTDALLIATKLRPVGNGEFTLLVKTRDNVKVSDGTKEQKGRIPLLLSPEVGQNFSKFLGKNPTGVSEVAVCQSILTMDVRRVGPEKRLAAVVVEMQILIKYDGPRIEAKKYEEAFQVVLVNATHAGTPAFGDGPEWRFHLSDIHLTKVVENYKGTKPSTKGGKNARSKANAPAGPNYLIQDTMRIDTRYDEDTIPILQPPGQEKQS